MRVRPCLVLAALLLRLGSAEERPVLAQEPHPVRAALATDQVSRDADDPAIWVCKDDPARSLILGTNKTAAPEGSLYVFGLDGKTRQVIKGLGRPNNVDVEYGLALGGRKVDIAVVTERVTSRLRIYEIPADGGKLIERSLPNGLRVFEGEHFLRELPMGVGLYRRPHDGAVFAIVSRKNGPREDYLWQYRIEDDGEGRVRARKVRAFGAFSGDGEIEAVAVDDALGFVYYADENHAIHKWHADPDHADAARELSVFGTAGFHGDREGIAIYACADGTGYIVCTDQRNHNSAYRLFKREGEPGHPHDHSRVVKVVEGRADSTDGLDICPAALGTRFPHGLVVAMSSQDRCFLLYSWDDFAAGEPSLKVDGQRE